MNCSKNPAFLLTSFVALIGGVLLVIKSEPIVGGLFFFPFSLGPLFVSMIIASSLRSVLSQISLCIGSILYGFWFGYVYMCAFYWHIDPQSAIALFFVGMYSLPVMLPMWMITYILQYYGKKIGGS